MVAAVETAHPAPFTVAEWIALVTGGAITDGRRVELVEGSLIVSPAPAFGHQYAADRLRTALETHAPGELVAVTAVGVPLPDMDSGLIPDVLVIERAAMIDGAAMPPVAAVRLAVEVVSPSSRMTDRRVKPEMYATACIPHFWRLELRPFRGRVPGEVLPVLFVHALSDAGEYELLHRIDASAPAKLAVPYEVHLDLSALTL